MAMKTWQKKLLKIVEPKLNRLDVGHRLDHSLRTFEICKIISKGYKNVDLDALFSASLLHDIGKILKPINKHGNKSVKLASEILLKADFPKNQIPQVLEIIKDHDNFVWVKNYSKKKPTVLEVKIFHDADELESMGAIGIGRNFIWAGKHNKIMFNEKKKFCPEIAYGGNISVLHTLDFEQSAYKYFSTKTGKKMAKNKYLFTKLFIKQFLKEWGNKN